MTPSLGAEIKEATGMPKTTAPGADHAFLPRSLPVQVSPEELHTLVRALEAAAARAAQDPDQISFADYLFRRVAALREAAR